MSSRLGLIPFFASLAMKRSLKAAFLTVCGSLGLFELARLLTRRWLNILCDHGFDLHDEASFRPKLFMHGDDFARSMKTVRRTGHYLLSLDEAITRLYERNWLGQVLDVSYDGIVQSRILDLLTPDELHATSASGVQVELRTHHHRFSTDNESDALHESEPPLHGQHDRQRGLLQNPALPAPGLKHRSNGSRSDEFSRRDATVGGNARRNH